MNDYIASGFDEFLSRGDTPSLQGALDIENTSNNAVPFDRTQVSGSLGDTLRLGNIFIDGSTGRISIYDDSGNEVVRLGELDG
jgi:hypothetical protein